jgi:hypothetical protein
MAIPVMRAQKRLFRQTLNLLHTRFDARVWGLESSNDAKFSEYAHAAAVANQTIHGCLPGRPSRILIGRSRRHSRPAPMASRVMHTQESVSPTNILMTFSKLKRKIPHFSPVR